MTCNLELTSIDVELPRKDRAEVSVPANSWTDGSNRLVLEVSMVKPIRNYYGVVNECCMGSGPRKRFRLVLLKMHKSVWTPKHLHIAPVLVTEISIWQLP
jgi:hypothetical protein